MAALLSAVAHPKDAGIGEPQAVCDCEEFNLRVSLESSVAVFYYRDGVFFGGDGGNVRNEMFKYINGLFI